MRMNNRLTIPIVRCLLLVWLKIAREAVHVVPSVVG